MLKVLHLPTSVGGNSWGLAQAEKQLGLDSKVLIEAENWLDYPYDFNMQLNGKNKYMKDYIILKTFLSIRNKFDIFHFNFGTSLAGLKSGSSRLWDLPFYNGKKIMTYNGCDVRQKYLTMQRVEFSACHEQDCYNGVCNSGVRDEERKNRIEEVSKNVDHIFSLNPDLLYFLPDKATFLPYTVAGWENIHVSDYIIDNKIKIIHSPTNRAAKGSVFILDALEKLQKKYINIDVEIIENLPYEEALKKYKEAHIVIDQVLIGWYGAFGVEVMKMGKPLAVFIREEDLQFIPNEMESDLKEAIININPFNVESVLEEYIQNPMLLYKKSEAALEYVYKWHNPLYVAGLTKEIYESV